MDGSNFDSASIRGYSPPSMEASTSDWAGSIQDDDSPWELGLTPDTIELPFDGDDDLDYAPTTASTASSGSRTAGRDPLLKIAEEGRSAAAKIRAPIAPLAPPVAPAAGPGGVGGAIPAFPVPPLAANGVNGLYWYMLELLSAAGHLTQGSIRESTVVGIGLGMGAGVIAAIAIVSSEMSAVPVAAKIGIIAAATLGTFVVAASVVELRQRGILC